MKDTRDIKDTSTLKPITDIKEIQSIERGILERVATFCEERGICYSLAYGTLLGAIRHKGFIPWDNDVDIFMPRPDYERFINEFSVEGLSLHSFEKQKDWYYPFVKITDDKTLVIEYYFGNSEIGVWIDIFPIDGFPSVKTAQCTTFKRRVLASFGNVRVGAKPRKLYKAILKASVQIILWVFPKQFFFRAIKKCTTRYGWEGQPYVANLTWGYNKGQLMSRSCVETFTDVEFEGRKYKAIAGWHTYLSNLYGDYMKLPPEEDRWVHPLKAWWK